VRDWGERTVHRKRGLYIEVCVTMKNLTEHLSGPVQDGKLAGENG